MDGRRNAEQKLPVPVERLYHMAAATSFQTAYKCCENLRDCDAWVPRYLTNGLKSARNNILADWWNNDWDAIVFCTGRDVTTCCIHNSSSASADPLRRIRDVIQRASKDTKPCRRCIQYTSARIADLVDMLLAEDMAAVNVKR